MRVAVWEYFCSGATEIPAELEPIRAEGLSMLHAVVDDLLRVQHAEVEVVCDRSLPSFPPKSARVTTAEPHTFDDTATLVASRSDCVLVIAPETDAILEHHFHLAQQTNARWCGVNIETIRICADKLKTYEYLEAAGVPTVTTSLFTGEKPGVRFPFVLKPRYGAGCEGTFVVRHEQDFVRVRSGEGLVIQPFVTGSSFSAAAVRTDSGWQLLPLVHQHIQGVQQLEYMGGTLEVSQLKHLQSDSRADVTQSQVIEALDAVEAETGWLGLDFIRDESGVQYVVDINPRLTTSYVGYRQATRTNLAECLLGRGTVTEWQPGHYGFNKSL